MSIKRETNSELLIAYFRVSTKKRGVSGLGLEGQQAAVNAYARANNGVIVKPYTEVESGKRSDRSQLRAALSHARCIGATLVVAKLDRLSRNVAFLSSLMESKVDFVACDNPHATKLALHILVAVAEAEAEAISQRTRAALAAYKARGGLLGASLPQCRNLTDAARLKGAKSGGEAVHQKALAAYEHILPMMRELRQAGKTLQSIADHLNAEGYTSRRGNPWSYVQVKFVLERV